MTGRKKKLIEVVLPLDAHVVEHLGRHGVGVALPSATSRRMWAATGGGIVGPVTV